LHPQIAVHPSSIPVVINNFNSCETIAGCYLQITRVFFYPLIAKSLAAVRLCELLQTDSKTRDRPCQIRKPGAASILKSPN
jgi:hypothetical protein